jgi:hypothetical protein
LGLLVFLDRRRLNPSGSELPVFQKRPRH